jgi:Skp family chaperone for outer membrane proteins
MKVERHAPDCDGRPWVSTMSQAYDWQRHYEAAILETECSRLRERIQVAQTAIEARRRELQSDHNEAAEEQHALEDALLGLAVLREERKM